MALWKMRVAAAAMAAASGTAWSTASGVQIQLNEPDFDRWMYPFNLTPGARGRAPTFGAIGAGAFDERDGQYTLGFDLAGLLPALGPGQAYQVNALQVTATHFTGGFTYDPTYDGYQTFLDPSDPDYIADADAGRPVVLTAAGLRNGYEEFGFGPSALGAPVFEEGDFFSLTDPNPPGVRNTFAQAFDGVDMVDVSNNVADRFDFVPFAVGQTNVAPGATVSEGVGGVSPGSTFTFDVNLAEPSVTSNLTEQLELEQLFFTISSLHSTGMSGGSNPNFYTNDNFDPAAIAPTLFLDVEVVSAALPGDANNDGVVDLLDFDVLAQNFGSPTGNGATDGDFNGDGTVDLLDFDILAQNFGATSPATLPGAIPEPASLALMGLGAAGLLRTRRRRRN